MTGKQKNREEETQEPGTGLLGHDLIPGAPLNGRNLVLTMLLNVLITAVEVVGGLLSGSLALISDALHNLSDVAAVGVSLAALRISRKRATFHHTFGFQRTEVLAALLNATVLVAVSVLLFKESIVRLLQPHPVNSLVMAGVGAFGLLANTLSVLLLRRQAGESLNVRSSYLHMFADALSSGAVVLGGILIYYFNVLWVDPALTIFIGLYVLKESYEIITRTVKILMESAPVDLDLGEVSSAVQKVPGVCGLHHVHVWQVGENQTYFEGHIDLDQDMPVSEAEGLCQQVGQVLKERFEIAHTVLQAECHGCPGVGLLHESDGRQT